MSDGETGNVRSPVLVPAVAVGALIVERGRLLLVKRAREPQRGLWSIPGGRVEPGETLAVALEREVLEETGLAVRCGPFVGFAELISVEHHFVVLDFWAELSGRAAVRAGERAHDDALESASAVGAAPVAGGDASDLTWAGGDQIGRLALVDGLGTFLARHRVLSRLR